MSESGDFISQYLGDFQEIINKIDWEQDGAIAVMVDELVAVRERGGRLFLIGVGGSAAHCSHAAADFRTLCDIEAYAFDNMANMTALTNDQGWERVFSLWLSRSNMSSQDLLYVMSVGGGSAGFSTNLCIAMNDARALGVPVIGVAGRDGGYLAQHARACVIVPTLTAAHVTPHTESVQAVIWHLLVSHPALKRRPTAWETK